MAAGEKNANKMESMECNYYAAQLFFTAISNTIVYWVFFSSAIPFKLLVNDKLLFRKPKLINSFCSS